MCLFNIKYQPINSMKYTILSIISILLLGGSLYALTLRGTLDNAVDSQTLSNYTAPTGAFESSHERASFALTLSVFYDRSLTLSKPYADFGAPDIGVYNGKFYSFFPPGVSFSILPFYALGSLYGQPLIFSYASVALVSVINLVMLFLILRKVFGMHTILSLLAPLIYGFASTSWSYSVTIFQHTYLVFFMLVMFLCGWKYTQKGRYSWIWAALVWLSFGLSFMFDYPNAFLLLPIIVYLALHTFSIDRKRSDAFLSVRLSFITTVVMFFIVMGVFAYYNFLAYGQAFRFSNTLDRYHPEEYGLEQRDTEAISAKKSEISSIFTENYVANGLYRLLIAPDKGIFFFSPLLVLGLLGVYAERKSMTQEKWLLVALAITNILLYASFGDPWGGWAFGPRYIFNVMAVLSIFTVFFIARYRHNLIVLISSIFLFIVSSSISLIGVLTTNMVPPKPEADYFKLKFNYLYNYDFLMQGKSGSVLYNNLLHQHIRLTDYYLAILAVLALLFILLLIGSYRVRNVYED